MDKLLSELDFEWFDRWYSEIEYRLAPKFKRPVDWQERAIRSLKNDRKKCCVHEEKYLNTATERPE